MIPKIKSHMVSTAVLLGSFVVILIILWKGLTLNPSHVSSTLIGKPAPLFKITWLQGKELDPSGSSGERLDFSHFRGKPTVLNFWASWCTSCREEARFFEEFWQAHKGQVNVIGVAIQDSPDAALEFARFFGKTYPLGLDQDGKVSIDYGVYGVPETFFIDADGVILSKETGPVTKEMLEKKFPR